MKFNTCRAMNEKSIWRLNQENLPKSINKSLPRKRKRRANNRQDQNTLLLSMFLEIKLEEKIWSFPN